MSWPRNLRSSSDDRLAERDVRRGQDHDGAGTGYPASRRADLRRRARRFLLRQVLPEPPGDFQHLPPWRPLVVETATQILRYADGTLIVPQTVLVEAYAREIFDGLAKNDIAMRHFVLHAERPELVRRIEGDTVETTRARQWRLDHVDRYTDALPWLRRSATIIDTQGKTAVEVAAEISGHLTDRSETAPPHGQ